MYSTLVALMSKVSLGANTNVAPVAPEQPKLTASLQ